ncbi:hypothetical protein [Glaciibacter psychrotolerans]|uniref:Uncharacterized membrane protein YjjP (DUF1212 family) n=1 Tax=Glaciibacter psychrotolerans TaxID=670054 RepID=A0A7Z0EBZ7_9MICO|nr:hypothetical protein [Leifsonia psychrotolerans]NYJ18646.1 uncharacterized membrane protein YjjP (DUF1212 family) [Leifsonia psychrotolerans]
MSTSSQRSIRPRTISALLAGFIAGFIWMAITVSIGGFTTATIVVGGIAFVVTVAIITFVIDLAVSRSMK